MNLTPAAPPIFLKPNYAKDSAGFVFGTSTPKITVTSMQALADRLVDMDPFSTWNSAGSTDSTNPQTIGIPLYVGVTQTLRTDIALIALLNINFKDFTISLSSDGGSTFTDMYAVTNNTLSNYIIDASASVKSADYIKIYVTTTFASTPDVEKFLGTVVMSGLIRQMVAAPMFPISRGVSENVKVLDMGDGSKNITYIKRSAASFEFYNANFNFKMVTDSELTAMRALRRGYPSFIFYPEPGDKTGEMYQSMFIPGSFQSQTSHTCKNLGNDLQFGIQEIG